MESFDTVVAGSDEAGGTVYGAAETRTHGCDKSCGIHSCGCSGYTCYGCGR